MTKSTCLAEASAQADVGQNGFQFGQNVFEARPTRRNRSNPCKSALLDKLKSSEANPAARPPRQHPDSAHRTGFQARARGYREGLVEHVCDVETSLPAPESLDAPRHHTSKPSRLRDTPRSCKSESAVPRSQPTPTPPDELRPDIRCGLPTWRALRRWVRA